MLSPHHAGAQVVAGFSVTVDSDQETAASLAAMLSREIAERALTPTDISIAIDCDLFNQHNLHSEFTDQKQIQQTIRFDAEDVLATDTSTLAVTFDINNTDQTGSDITIFTTQRNYLAQTLTELQANNLDPIAIEPDIVCLARFLQRNFNSENKTSPLFIVLAENKCYIIQIPSENQSAPWGRSFLINQSQNINDVLARELMLTIASCSARYTVDSIFIAGQTEPVNFSELAEKTGKEITTIDLAQIVSGDKNLLTDCHNDSEFAIAYGSAMAEIKKIRKTDFRQDFAPYQGKKIVIQKTLRFLSLVTAVLMISIGVYFQMQVFMQNKYTRQLEDKLTEEYSSVMYGKKPPAQEPVSSRLKRELVQINKVKSGLIGGDDESIPAKLTFILEAINGTPDRVKVNINSINIAAKTIRIIGSTNSRSSTLKLFNEIKKHKKLKLDSESVKQKGNRNTFTINLKLI